MIISGGMVSGPVNESFELGAKEKLPMPSL